mmetsp:Transcript_13274/g.19098  ORF Transcript_13274/g.19098 Transcript_13274/m.19098 type:complete len:80 (-) Transcript_13274:87-326(-)
MGSNRVIAIVINCQEFWRINHMNTNERTTKQRHSIMYEPGGNESTRRQTSEAWHGSMVSTAKAQMLLSQHCAESPELAC